MVDIQSAEVKTLVLHHVYKVSTSEMIKSSLTPQGIVRPLFWAEGVLFNYYTLPLDVEDVSKDFLNGKEHWAEVYWTEQPVYKEMIELDEEHLKGVKIRVIDAGAFSPHRELAKWLKGKAKKQ